MTQSWSFVPDNSAPVICIIAGKMADDSYAREDEGFEEEELDETVSYR